MTKPYFATRQQVRQVKAALRAATVFSGDDPSHDEIVAFFEDLVASFAEQRPEIEEEAFAYVIRCMGEVVAGYIDAYEAHGCPNPFIDRRQRVI